MADWSAFPEGTPSSSSASPPSTPQSSTPPTTVRPISSAAAPANAGSGWDAFPAAPLRADSPSSSGPIVDATGNTGALSNSGSDGWSSGALKGAATGAIQGAGHILGQVGDTRNLARFLASRAASMFDSKGRTGAEIYDDMVKRDAADDASSIIPTPAGLLGDSTRYTDPVFARTGQYNPTTEVGKLGQAAVAAGVGGIGPGGGAAALERTAAGSIVPTGIKTLTNTITQQGLGNAAAGVGSQAVGDATGSEGAALIAGLAAPAAAHGFKSAARSVGDLMRTGANRDVRVGRDILANSSDPSAMTSALSGPSPVDPSLGVKLTTPEFTQDPGLLSAQRKLRGQNSASYIELEQANNSAMRSSLANSSPVSLTADPMAPSQFLAAHGKHLDDAAQQAVDLLTQRAKDAGAGKLGDAVNPEDQGATIRQQLQHVMDQKNTLRREAYAAVDPNNTLVADSSAIPSAAKSVSDRLTPYDTQSDAEQRLFKQAASMSAATPYGHVVSFDKALNDVMPNETPTGKFRLGQLKDAVVNTLHGTADRAAAADPSVHERLSDLWQPGPRDALGAADRVAGEARGVPTSPAAADAAALGTAGNPGGRLGPAAGGSPDAVGGQGDRSLTIRPAGPERFTGIPVDDDTAITSRPVPPSVPKPQDLHGFIRSLGGIQDRNGDVASMGLSNLVAKPGQGLGADAVRQVAAEAGYLGADTNHAMAHTDVNDLYGAMGHDQPIYSVRDGDAAAAWDNHREMMEQYGRVSGPTSKPAAPPKAPLSAYDREDAYPPGMAPAPVNSNTKLRPNADAAAGVRIAAAKASHVDYLQYKQSEVGKALATNGYKGQYNVSNASIPGRAIRTGDRGYEAAREFIVKSQQDPHVIGAMKDTVLDPLRKVAGGKFDGAITDQMLSGWKQKYAGALRAIDEVEPGFSKKFDNAAQATNDMIRANAIKKASLDEFQSGAAAKLIGKTDEGEAQAEILAVLRDQRNGPTRMKSLVAQLRQDPTGNALAGAQKLAVDGLSRTLVNTAQSGVSGEKGLSAAKVSSLARDHDAAMRVLFPSGQTPNTVHSIARALDVLNAEHTATRTKGTSQTARDRGSILAGLLKSDPHAEGHAQGIFSLIGLDLGESAVTHGLGTALKGALPLAAGLAVKAVRGRGMSADQALLKQAMLDPNVAKALVKAAQTKGTGTSSNYLVGALRRSLITAPIIRRSAPAGASLTGIASSGDHSRPEYSYGGAVPPRTGYEGLPPHAGGPAAPSVVPSNPEGLPAHVLNRISYEVRSGLRAPTWPDRDRVPQSHNSDHSDDAGHYAKGGRVPAGVLRALQTAGRGRFADGGVPVEYRRPHFEDGGDAGGGDSSSSGMGGFGGFGGGGYGGVGGSVGGYGGLASGMSTSSGSFGLGGPNTASAGNFGSAGGISGTAGGVNSSAANNASVSSGNSSGYGNTSSGSYGSLGSHSTSSPSTSSSGMSSGSTGGFGGDSYGGSSGVSSGMSGGFGGFGLGGFDGSGSPASNSMGSIGATTGMAGNGISGMPGGINSSDANSASASMGNMSAAPSFGAFGGFSPSNSTTNAAGMGESSGNYGWGAGTMMGSVGAPTAGSFDGGNPGMDAHAMNAAISEGYNSGYGAGGVQGTGNIGFGGFSATGDMSNGPFGHFGSQPAAPGSNEVSGYGVVSGPTTNNAIGFGNFGSEVGSFAPSGFDTGFGQSYSRRGETPGVAGAESGFANVGPDGQVSPGYGSMGMDAQQYGVQAALGVNPNEVNTLSAPATVDGMRAVTIHGPQSVYSAPGAFADDTATSMFANAGLFQKAAASQGLNISPDRAAAFANMSATNESGLKADVSPGAVPGMIDAGALNPTSNALGFSQDLSKDRLGGMLAAVEAGAGLAPGALDKSNFATAQAWADAVRNAPASLYSQMQYTAHEIATNPAFSGMKAALTSPNINTGNLATGFASFEGAFTPGQAGYAGYVGSAADAARRGIAGYNGVSNSDPSNLGEPSVTGVTPTTSVSPATQQVNNPSAPPAAAPTSTGPAQADPSKMTPEQRTAWDNAPNPNDPTHTNDGTPLSGSGISGPETAPTQTVNPHVANTIANLGLGMLGPIGGIAALGNFASGMLGGPTIGDGLNGLLGGMGEVGWGSPGTPANSLGSNNGRVAEGPNGRYVPAPPAAKGKGKGKGKKGSEDPGPDETETTPYVGRNPLDFYNPTTPGYIPPGTGNVMPYNPLSDPVVLRALGYAA